MPHELFSRLSVLHPLFARRERNAAAEAPQAAGPGYHNRLLPRFEQLVLGQQAYLEPGLTIQDVATRLHSNKTYVYRLVRDQYHLAFPDLINRLRTDYARQYILDHPDARQDEVARASGFPDAPAFNRIFQKITGLTPRLWTVAHTSASSESL